MNSFSEQGKISQKPLEDSSILSVFYGMTLEKQVQKLKSDVKRNTELLNESRKLNRNITEFISNVSHELKTPLNVIFAAIQVLAACRDCRDQKCISKQDEYLKIMKQNCYRLTRLINNLLDISKLDSGFIKLNCHNRNIVSVVEDITLSLVPYVESKNIELIFDTNIEEKVMAIDSDKMERIILNLLSNAVKFTPEKGKIYVNVEYKDEIVYITIRDTGIGIPEDKQQIIFERFGQVGASAMENNEGSGIGLYLAKSFVKLHGGEIYVRSEIGKGSEFTIKLPVKIIEENCIRDISCKNKEELNCKNKMKQINMEFADMSFKI
ncbi:sensor histidine kinase [Clostridium sp. WILCCON 0269]|uniref:histidine kinase n=1 Tax=Candidatus Clostridium eludens TaxID=3381663 RepID=A0ABW8SEA7_9CLOT